VKKPFPWYGGKEQLAPLLVSLLPRHEVYVEVFGGSGAVLFAKESSPLEVFNDLDSGVVNFFRVLRDPVQAEQLAHLLSLTPYAYEEYHTCLKEWQHTEDSVEKARMWYCGVVQSMNSSIRATGWSHTKMPGSNPAKRWQPGVAHLAACVNRLAQVQIDHRDFEPVFRSYDGLETCFYVDPPYTAETRRKRGCYRHEMSTKDHERLLCCLLDVQGMVLLSGYDHPLYQEALHGWECLTYSVSCASTSRAAVQGEKCPQTKRQECIWRNPACVRRSYLGTQMTLFT